MPAVAQYIAMRLKELGAEHLFFVPGNYTAEFLLAAEKCGIHCVGTTNELEAGYAADAYARYRRIGVCSVTYGVGSQSLYNAIAGAYVEFCPVVMLNGSPTLDKVESLKNDRILFAHAIDPLRTDRLIFEPITVAAAEITSPDDAPAEIDRVLRACITQRRPVYLEVHQTVWQAECDAPSGALLPESPTPQQEHDRTAATAAVVAIILQQVRAAKHPVLWGGPMLDRWGLVDSFSSLVQTSGLPYSTTLMGKGLIAESSFPRQFIGVYDSKFARRDVADVIEQSDCLLALGTILSDFYADIAMKSADRMIIADGAAVTINRTIYPHVPLNLLLEGLIANWDRGVAAPQPLPGLAELVEARTVPSALMESASRADTAAEARITWTSFFDRLGSFVNDEMIVLTDTSLALFPSAELPIARRGGYVAQAAWLSIGYTCGATLGVALAVPEARPIAIVGDGGFQMVPQAFSTLVRQKKSAVVFVMDNGLYGIEQFLIDSQILPAGSRYYRDRLPVASSFDVLPLWDYEKLAQAFGGEGYAASTVGQLNKVLAIVATLQDQPALVAIRLESHDLPRGIAEAVFGAVPSLQLEAAFTAPPAHRTEISWDGFN